MRWKRAAVVSVLVAALGLSAAPGAPASAQEDRKDASEEIYAALERDLGLSRKQAEELGRQQERATRLDLELQKSLGAAYAGAWFDSTTGRLVVNVTDKAALEQARAAGADARLAKHDLRKLESIKAELDAMAGVRADNLRRQASTGRDIGLSAWTVDPVTNTVEVLVTPEQAGRAKELLARYGSAVTLTEVPTAPEVAANFMDGGDEINNRTCSAGFNLRNPTTKIGYLLTAGHCVSAGSTLRGQGNVVFGKVLESWFPTFDDAIARNDNPGYWIQGPWVDTNPSNSGVVTSSGFTDGPVGTVICKSGITTKWTCGKITAKNETVTYSGGFTVHGLTRHDACVEKGDSGGANISVNGSIRRAEGVTSGASLIKWDGKLRCIGAIFGWLGIKSVSWYFPIADSLAYYGPRYGVTTW